MATAVIEVLDHERKPLQCRTLIDTCSNANFMTADLAQKLRLPCRPTSVTIGTLNQVHNIANQVISATIKSRLTNYNRSLSFFTIPKIATPLPDAQINRAALHIPANLKLADPEFHRPAPVDMLIGTGPALSCLSVGQIDISPPNGPDLILQKTQLGWIIGGSVPSTTKLPRNTFSTTLELDMRKFWEVEEGPQQQHLSSEERDCEAHFVRNVRRAPSGRYVVALPFNEKKELLGDSRSRALNRLLSLERKLNRDSDLKREYTAVINEYLSLGHMTLATTTPSPGFYLPHHAVIKPTSSTTKVRVVFDGSARSSSGVSLNDALMTGPTIQDDLFTLLIRFRMHVYVLTGDIEKMYRQFLVRPEDRQYQRILWRDPHGQVVTYELNTITFGLSPAPYLATRCLQQLAEDEQNHFPLASMVVRRDLYVDDLLTGADTLEEATTMRNEIISLFQRAGLNIRQWASNEPRLLTGLQKAQLHPKILGDSTLKTLGISWDAHDDRILYRVQDQASAPITKRTILSTIARIFDPLGLIGPVVITAKLIMQRLWQLKLDWDESLPTALHTEWLTFITDLNQLNNVSFPRTGMRENTEEIELHGFCDASERAYGACLYTRSTGQRGHAATNLLCAKSRVALLKTISLARLELCGAVLLSTLFTAVHGTLRQKIKSVTFWTDSTVVINWINREPNTLKTFVANRVAEIQSKTSAVSWRHVNSADNPADLLSRGISPTHMGTATHWKHGPTWLKKRKTAWPRSIPVMSDEIPESKKITCLSTTVQYTDDFIQRYSELNKLRRVVARCCRFLPKNRAKGTVTAEELQDADRRIIRLVQAITFPQEVVDLRNKTMQSNSKLRPLHPFLDDQGILRVGGRLHNSSLPFSQKHPALLPKGHHLTELIIREAHIRTHHAGIMSTLNTVRQRYWPIDGRNVTRHIVRKCVRCFRANPPSTNYLMGNLPATRVTAHRPFHHCGVDYCGPFYIKERRYRNRARIKIYVAVFVCFATKAVHLEVVSDMTTEAFMAALRRFIARRGICHSIHSDNGTNFVGGNNELQELYKTFREDTRLQHFLADKGISWHFMPALSPHFGGLWEAAVKSFKHHLKRVVGIELFTYEQFNTFVIEIEAILNSRPLTPLSSDPNDPSALTPGHLLIGNSLTSIPETDFSNTPVNRLSTWQHIQKVKQDFWSRWHKEYINHLNVRHKWTKATNNIEKGMVVVLKEDNLPSLFWHLGRVEATHPGSDGIVRAVTVRTPSGTYKRNVRKLAPLPITETSSG